MLDKDILMRPRGQQCYVESKSSNLDDNGYDDNHTSMDEAILTRPSSRGHEVNNAMLTQYHQTQMVITSWNICVLV